MSGLEQLPPAEDASAAAFNAKLLPLGMKVETYPRQFTSTQSVNTVGSRFDAAMVYIPKGTSLTKIMGLSGATAAVGLTNQWFAIVDVTTGLVVAVTSDDGATAWGANVPKTLNIAGGPWVATSSTGLYYLGRCVTAATTQPTQSCFSGTASAATIPPQQSGTMALGAATPPAIGTLITLVNNGNAPYLAAG